MTLDRWFYRNTKIPLFLAGFFVLLLWTGGAVDSYLRFHKHLRVSLDQLSEMASVTLEQRNRALMEALVYTSKVHLDVSAVALCEGSEQLISSSPGNDLCGWSPQALNRRLFEQDLVGHPSKRLVVLSNPWLLGSSFLWLYWALSFSFLLLSLWILRRTSLKFNHDIIRPLREGVFYQHKPFNITELEEIRRRSQEFFQAQTQIAIVEALNRQSRQVAHDIRSPLSALAVVLDQVGERSHITPAEKSLLSSVLQRISGIARRLEGQMAEIEANEATKEFALTNLVEEILREKSAHINGSKNVTFQSRLKCLANYKCRVDKIELGRALSNLLDNAVDAIACKGEILITGEVIGSEISLEISDNGEGIPPQVLASVGQYKFSYGKSKGDKKGNGLGVYQVRSFMSAIGGALKISSLPGEGTKVKLTFPGNLFFPTPETGCLDQKTSPAATVASV